MICIIVDRPREDKRVNLSEAQVEFMTRRTSSLRDRNTSLQSPKLAELQAINAEIDSCIHEKNLFECAYMHS